jgi:hypothetical protein
VTIVSDLVTRALSQDFDTTTWSADAGRFVRDAIADIYTKIPLVRGDTELTVNLTAGTGSTPFVGATGDGPIVSAILNDLGDPLDELDREELRSLQIASPAARGRPRLYAIATAGEASENVTVLFFPAADRAYAFTVIGRLVPVATDLDDADPLPLPIRYEKLPVYYARAELFALTEEDANMSAFWRAKYDQGIREAAADLGRRGSSRRRRVPGTWSDVRTAGPSFHRPGLF